MVDMGLLAIGYVALVYHQIRNNVKFDLINFLLVSTFLFAFAFLGNIN